MSRARKEDDEALGYDSFLDVVANLVGILIILVVVVGAQAGSMLHSSQSEEEQQLVAQRDELQQRLTQHRREAFSIEQDTVELENRLQQEEALAESAARERDRLQQLIVLGEQALERERSELESTAAQSAQQQFQLASLTRARDELAYELEQIQTQPRPTSVLEHHCTPLAQTVFSDEVHFRLHQGRITHVPMSDLVDLMTRQIEFQLEKLRTAQNVVDTVGPLEEFRLQYEIRQEERAIQTEFGVMRRTVPQFAGFILLPTRPILGLPVEQVLADESSEFQKRLAMANPQETTITVWVYPDSYEEYLLLENWLHERGFLVASWPLPADRPIAGGPNGMRSSAQ